MAVYTASQLKDFSSIYAVQNFSDAKILIYQQIAESIIDSLCLDNSQSGYDDAYNSAVVLLFDWLAGNPTAIQTVSKGKMSQEYAIESLPITVRSLLYKFYKDTDNGLMNNTINLEGVSLERNDIGLR